MRHFTPLHHDNGINLSVLFLVFILAGLTLFTASCAKNPVTGKNELRLVSTQQEIAMGTQNYLHGQQSQGGTYVLDQELSQYISQVGQKCAAQSSRPLPYEFVIINNSVPNAWAMPGGKIAIYRGLLVHLKNEAELAAVLGHEITHAAARHSAQSMERGLLIGAGVATTAAVFDDGDTKGELIAMGAAATGTLLTMQYSQNAEFEADKYGIQIMAQAGYHPQAAVDLQKTFVKLANEHEPHWLAGLFASHPPSQKRVERNQVIAKTYPNHGEYGQQQYQQKIAQLKKWQPAYEKYDAGMTALSKKQADKALMLATEAIELLPQESKFYSLKGDALVLKRQYPQAIDTYGQAIQRNSKHFYAYQQRGLTYQQVRQYTSAKSDLKTAYALYPNEATQQALMQLEAITS